MRALTSTSVAAAAAAAARSPQAPSSSMCASGVAGRFNSCPDPFLNPVTTEEEEAAARADNTADSTAKRTEGSKPAGSRMPTVSASHSEMAPPSRGSSGGTVTPRVRHWPTPDPELPPSNREATARSCAPASAADSLCSPGNGDASPHPTAPPSSSTLSSQPSRTMPVPSSSSVLFSSPPPRPVFRRTAGSPPTPPTPLRSVAGIVVGRRSMGSEKRLT
mmetsp:Transcript_31270/g.78312  ORF Transcript_31270/g.78312 Transcript_31270/m.78312 type:complete len:219 (+) Transcript_31270:1517-2173(+)